ncbi:MAG: hypothetical protein PHH01_01875 [Patescibacteria group bacterium]|nr:hypothetical protein [Patescibacteria group bacterium]
MLRRIPFHLLFLVLAVILLIPVSPAQALPTQPASDNANIAVTTISPQTFGEGQHDVVFDNDVTSSSYDWTTNSTIPPALAIEEVWHDVIFSNDVANTSNLNESTTYAVASCIDAATYATIPMPTMFEDGQYGAIDTNYTGCACSESKNYAATNDAENLRLEAVLVVILPMNGSRSENIIHETNCGAQLNS